MHAKILVPIAPGCEEIETVTVIDVLRRAELDVTVARVPAGEQPESLLVTASRGVKLQAEVMLADVSEQTFDAIVLPGGLPGAEHLRDDPTLTDLLRRQIDADRIVAAICAAPAVVLAHHDLLGGRRATCHPTCMDQLPAESRSGGRVVTSGNLITSRSPGTAMEFALAIVAALCGQDLRNDLARQLLLA